MVQAIKHAKEGIFELKRARLLREADTMLGNARNSVEEVKVEPLASGDMKPQIVDLTDVTPDIIDLTGDNPEPVPLEEDQQWCIGSKCRFQYNDQRWYDGEIVGLEGDMCAKLAFLIPTSEKMLVSTDNTSLDSLPVINIELCLLNLLKMHKINIIAYCKFYLDVCLKC